MRLVSVALPVRNGGPRFGEVLAAVRAQDTPREVDLVVVDSGSTDGSDTLAERHGARVERIPPHTFRHGGTRNRLMELTRGEIVVFLTQDATPATPDWLERLIAPFDQDPGVALACGPYLPRPDAPISVARELTEYFASFPDEIVRGPAPGPGPQAFFTSANGAVRRDAWERVPFRDVPYAEDQRLALDMLVAGYAKAFVRDAAVVHSHAYPPLQQLRRFFDEFRALAEVHGHREPLHPRRTLGRIRREVARDRAYARSDLVVLDALRYHGLRAVGAALGTRAGSLPPAARRALSLERRASYEPSHG